MPYESPRRITGTSLSSTGAPITSTFNEKTCPTSGCHYDTRSRADPHYGAGDGCRRSPHTAPRRGAHTRIAPRPTHDDPQIARGQPVRCTRKRACLLRSRPRSIRRTRTAARCIRAPNLGNRHILPPRPRRGPFGNRACTRVAAKQAYAGGRVPHCYRHPAFLRQPVRLGTNRNQLARRRNSLWWCLLSGWLGSTGAGRYAPMSSSWISVMSGRRPSFCASANRVSAASVGVS